MSDVTFVEKKPMEGREHSPSAGDTVGREGCDVNLMDPEVSRRHAAFRAADGGGLAIEDLGSTNGTYVNGSRISSVTVLGNGDELRFGNTVWTARVAAAAGATTVGEVPAAAAAPQVTAARSIPTDIQTPAVQATTAQAVPAAQQPAQPAAPSAAQVGPRGDVEQPPDVAPSAIRRVLPPPPAGQAPSFTPPAGRLSGSAATRVDATIVCLLIVLASAIGLVIYFVTY